MLVSIFRDPPSTPVSPFRLFHDLGEFSCSLHFEYTRIARFYNNVNRLNDNRLILCILERTKIFELAEYEEELTRYAVRLGRFDVVGQ